MHQHSNNRSTRKPPPQFLQTDSHAAKRKCDFNVGNQLEMDNVQSNTQHSGDQSGEQSGDESESEEDESQGEEDGAGGGGYVHMRQPNDIRMNQGE